MGAYGSEPMSNQNIELKTLSLVERKEYEELKKYYSIEAKRLRQQKVFLGLAVVMFIAAISAFQFFEFSV